jgi:hypothetical protein
MSRPCPSLKELHHLGGVSRQHCCQVSFSILVRSVILTFGAPEHGQECCQEDYQTSPPLKHLSCFRGMHLPEEDSGKLGAGLCLDPVQIFSSEPRKRRCGRDEDCAGDHSAEGSASKCLALDKKEQILRIGYVLPPFLQRSQQDQEEKIILWSGPKVEVYEQGS